MIHRIYLRLDNGEAHSMVEFERFPDGRAGLAIHLLEEKDGHLETTARTGTTMTRLEATEFREMVESG